MDKKTFYRSVILLVIPIAIQNLINVGVQAADVFMLGMIGEIVVSGASLAAQTGYILTLIIFGLTSGAAVLSSQYWGKGDVDSIEKILGISLRVSFYISFIFLLISFLFPEMIMKLFTSEREVIIEGSKYLKIICFSYVLISFTMVYLNVMRSVEKVIIATCIYTTSLIINIILNSILIFGLLGFERMGVQGAAVGTLISRVLEVLMVIIYDRKLNKILKIKIKYVFSKQKQLLKDFLKYSLPVVLNELLWGGAMAVSAGILGHMGSEAAAASSVIQVIRQLAMIVSFGIATVAAVMIGKVIGENKIEMAKIYSKEFIKIAMVSGVLGAIIVLVIGPVSIDIINLGETSESYLKYMIIEMVYYVFVQAVTCTIIVGIFRAGGDTKMGLVADVTTMWFGSIILGLIGAFVLKLSVPVVFILLLSDEILKVPIVFWRFKSYKWLNNITR